MADPASTVNLLELDPDVETLLEPEELHRAAEVRLPLRTLAADTGEPELSALLAENDAFGAIVAEGMMVRRLRVANHVGIRLLGAGDLLIPGGDARTMLLTEAEVRAAARAKLILLGDDVLVAIRRWPAIVVRLLERYAEQAVAVETQLVISQLPRVDERLFAILWLLAERWGRVTPIGTRVSLRLTHEMLGALIGASRPSVTLALGHLANRGAVLRDARGWLLTEPPPTTVETHTGLERNPLYIQADDGSRSPWRSSTEKRPPSPPEPEPLEAFRRGHEAHLASQAGRRRNEYLRGRTQELVQTLEEIVRARPRRAR
jgi:CRP/FNR family transcriptional regulator, cyclic AMP receptor protein